MRMIGWLRAAPREGAAESGLAMAGATGDPWKTVASAHPGELVTCVDGEIRWSDAALADMAGWLGQSATLGVAWREHGERVGTMLGGHYALAIVDPRAGKVLLATDRMGTRPLCFARVGTGGLVFASSAADLRRPPAVAARLSPQAIYDYVYFHMVPSPCSVYHDILKLERASMLVFADGRLATKRTWTPSFVARPDASFDALAEELRAVLRDAVRRCRPDETSASFLSGGLDSSTVCGIHREIAGRVTPAYTIGFSAAGYDEMEYARIAARHFALDLREHYVTADDIATSMRDIARAYDEPFGNSSAVPTLACARRARADGIRVMLAGDGG